MLRISRLPARPALDWEPIRQAMLNWGFLRVGLPRPGSAEELPAYLRQDLGLPLRQAALLGPRDLPQ